MGAAACALAVQAAAFGPVVEALHGELGELAVGMDSGEAASDAGDGFHFGDEVGEAGEGSADLAYELHVFEDAQGGLEAVARDEGVA